MFLKKWIGTIIRLTTLVTILIKKWLKGKKMDDPLTVGEFLKWQCWQWGIIIYLLIKVLFFNYGIWK